MEHQRNFQRDNELFVATSVSGHLPRNNKIHNPSPVHFIPHEFPVRLGLHPPFPLHLRLDGRSTTQPVSHSRKEIFYPFTPFQLILSCHLKHTRHQLAPKPAPPLGQSSRAGRPRHMPLLSCTRRRATNTQCTRRSGRTRRGRRTRWERGTRRSDRLKGRYGQRCWALFRFTLLVTRPITSPLLLLLFGLLLIALSFFVLSKRQCF